MTLYILTCTNATEAAQILRHVTPDYIRTSDKDGLIRLYWEMGRMG